MTEHAAADVAPEAALDAVCESCAGDDEDLAWVWPLPVESAEEPQLWCSDCRDRFPYEDADEPEALDDV